VLCESPVPKEPGFRVPSAKDMFYRSSGWETLKGFWVGTVMVRRRMKLALWGAALCVLATVPAPAQVAGPLEVDVKLVIATDISNSIDDEELSLERQGIADVFKDPEVVKVITNGRLGVIAVAMLDWAGYRENQVVLDWHIIRDKASAEAFANQVLDLKRFNGQRTSISDALERATAMLNDSDNRIMATRKVIDVSGDGPNNDGISLQQIHDETKDNGIVVNGLPIMDENADGFFPELDKYYGACVVSGRNGFLVIVKSFKDFGQAMRRKIVIEVSENESQIKRALGALPKNPLFQTIAAANASPAARFGNTRPAPEFPGGCDKFGGWKTNVK